MRNIFKRSFLSSKEEPGQDGYGWRVETEGCNATPHGDAATLPIDTWTADPEEDSAMFEQTQPTTRIPKIIPDGPEASFIALSYNDVDAACMAAHTLRKTRSIEVVLAGLWEYVSRHPEVNLGAVAA